MTRLEEFRQIAKGIWPMLKEKIREFVNSFVGTATETELATKLNADATAVMAASIPFGSVDAGSAGDSMTATVPGITELRDGVCAYIQNSVVTSKATWTLNVNGLGAKPVYPNISGTRSTTIFNSAYTMLFVYREDRVSGG
jgi:hypothetical protein